MRQSFVRILAAACVLAAATSFVHAAPYASGISITGGTTVNYVMNQDSDVLEISINGVAFSPALDGTAKGAHSFTIPSGATFSIRADKSEQGFLTPDGGTLARAGAGLAYATPSTVGTLISDDTNINNRFFAPRGVSVSQDPNAPNFGYAYIADGIGGATTTAGTARTTTDGIYAIKADQTDAFGQGNTARGTSITTPATANTPYRLTVVKSGEVYVAGFGDAVSGVFRMPAVWPQGGEPTVTTVLAGTTGPGSNSNGSCTTTTNCLPLGQNHGSVLATAVTGSTATNDLTLYTIDEDLTSGHFTRNVATDPKGVDNNKVWQYNIGNNALPYSGAPTAVTPNSPLVTGFSVSSLDLDRGADGKIYISQNRAQPANSTGLFVTDASGTELFNSRLATAAIPALSTPAGDYNHDGSKTALDYVIWRKQKDLTAPGLDADGNGDGTVDQADYAIWLNGNGLPSTNGATEAGYADITNDLYSNVAALAVSPDQKWLATLHANHVIMLTPLVSGIPDVANRLAVQAGDSTKVNARDIAWDAAGNLHYVGANLEIYRVIAPGGHTQATTSWNGTSYAFNIVPVPGAGSLDGGMVPEPSTLVLALTGIFALGIRRRRS